MAEPLKLKSGKTLVPSRASESNPSSENSERSPLWLKGYKPSIAPTEDTFVITLDEVSRYG